MHTRTLCIAVLAGTLGLAGCGESEPAAGGGATVVDETPTGETGGDATTTAPAEEETTEEATEAEVGTREDPVEVGTSVDLGDWEVAITEVFKEATEQIMAENEFNEEPAEGRQFVMWSVDATYTGDDSGTAWIDLGWGFVGSEGNTFNIGEEDYCGSIPNSLQDTGETFPDASVSGNVCVSVPSGQVDGGTIFVENNLSFESNRVFFAVP